LPVRFWDIEEIVIIFLFNPIVIQRWKLTSRADGEGLRVIEAGEGISNNIFNSGNVDDSEVQAMFKEKRDSRLEDGVVARFGLKGTKNVDSIHVVAENDELFGNEVGRAEHWNDGEDSQCYLLC
jgi:hypothetical protein